MFKKLFIISLFFCFSSNSFSSQEQEIKTNNSDISVFKFDGINFNTKKEELSALGYSCIKNNCELKNGSSVQYKENSAVFSNKYYFAENFVRVSFIKNSISMIYSEKTFESYNQSCKTVISSIKTKLQTDFKMNVENPPIDSRYYTSFDVNRLEGVTIFDNNKNLTTKITCIALNNKSEVPHINIKFEFYNDNAVNDAFFE